MERVKAGADFKEFNTLRGNFATELSIIRDRMSSGSSAKDPLRRYYAAYQDVLDLYSFAASVWRQKISFDECMGPTLSPGDPHDLDGVFAFQDRFQICWKSHGRTTVLLAQQAASPKINCPDSREDLLGCVLKNAQTKLASAEALLLKR